MNWVGLQVGWGSGGETGMCRGVCPLLVFLGRLGGQLKTTRSSSNSSSLLECCSTYVCPCKCVCVRVRAHMDSFYGFAASENSEMANTIH